MPNKRITILYSDFESSGESSEEESLSKKSRKELIHENRRLKSVNRDLRAEISRLKTLKCMNEDLPEYNKKAYSILSKLKAAERILFKIPMLHGSKNLHLNTLSGETEESIVIDKIETSNVNESQPTESVDKKRLNNIHISNFESNHNSNKTKSTKSMPQKINQDEKFIPESPRIEINNLEMHQLRENEETQSSHLSLESYNEDYVSQTTLTKKERLNNGDISDPQSSDMSKPIVTIKQERDPDTGLVIEPFYNNINEEEMPNFSIEYYAENYDSKIMFDNGVDLGAGVIISREQFNTLLRKKSISYFTTKMLPFFFSQEELCTHSLTGRRSGNGKQYILKPALDPVRLQAAKEQVFKFFPDDPRAEEKFMLAVKHKLGNVSSKIRFQKLDNY